MAEYVIEVRDDRDSDVWHPAVGYDPLTDDGTWRTEDAVIKLRAACARENREEGWYRFRTRYVPDANVWNPTTGRFEPVDDPTS